MDKKLNLYENKYSMNEAYHKAGKQNNIKQNNKQTDFQPTFLPKLSGFNEEKEEVKLKIYNKYDTDKFDWRQSYQSQQNVCNKSDNTIKFYNRLSSSYDNLKEVSEVFVKSGEYKMNFKRPPKPPYSYVRKSFDGLIASCEELDIPLTPQSQFKDTLSKAGTNYSNSKHKLMKQKQKFVVDDNNNNPFQTNNNSVDCNNNTYNTTSNTNSDLNSSNNPTIISKSTSLESQKSTSPIPISPPTKKPTFLTTKKPNSPPPKKPSSPPPKKPSSQPFKKPTSPNRKTPPKMPTFPPTTTLIASSSSSDSSTFYNLRNRPKSSVKEIRDRLAASIPFNLPSSNHPSSIRTSSTNKVYMVFMVFIELPMSIFQLPNPF